MDNYFNYFTEIETYFQVKRGVPILLSPLDWALIESWKEAGIPLGAVCAGIERSFQKYSRRPRRLAKINGLGYCTQQVMLAAEEAKQASLEGGHPGRGKTGAPPFEAGEILSFLDGCCQALEKAAARERENGAAPVIDDLSQAASSLREAAARGAEALLGDLERLENFLTALEEKLMAGFTRGSPVELLSRVREEVDRGINPYRRKMTAAQIQSLHSQFLKQRLFEQYQIPRLSLFYL